MPGIKVFAGGMWLLQKTVVEKYAQADFGSGEIEKTLFSGYQYASVRKADAVVTDLGPKVQGSFYGMPEEEEEGGFGGCLVRKK